MVEFVDISSVRLPDGTDVDELLSTQEYTILRDTIKEVGILYPLLVDENGVILDGKKRYLAYRELNINPIPVSQSYDDALRYVRDKIDNDDGLKSRIIRYIKEKGISYRKASSLFNIPKSTLFDWSKLYDPTIDSLSLLSYLSKEPISILDLAEQVKLPTSTLRGMIQQLVDMGFKITISDDGISLDNPIHDQLVGYLTTPHTVEELSNYLNIPSSIVPHLIDAKRKEGWDIRAGYINNKEVYFFGGTHTRSDILNLHGVVQLPIAVISDIHIGSKWFDESALRDAFNNIESQSIQHILMPGDIIQGVGVYGRESLDLSLFNIDDQIKLAVDLLSTLIPESVTIHMIMGNHEDAVKSRTKQGIDPVLHIARQLRSERPDLTINYYGHDAVLVISNLVKRRELLLNPNNPKFVPLESPYLLYMIHGQGRGAYAVSYPGQKIIRSLPFRPDILVVGHFHKLAHFKAEGVEVIMSGTFQGRNHFFTGVGNDTQKGYVILSGLGTPDPYYNRLLVNLIPYD